MFQNYEKDYVMRQIKMLGQLLVRLLLHSDKVTYELPAQKPEAQSDVLYLELCRLVSEGRINEAENRLYEAMETRDEGTLRVAVDFYLQLNERDDDFLEAHDFTRGEIEEGLRLTAERYGVVL